MNNGSITINQIHLEHALALWEKSARDGECLTPEESRAMPLGENAHESMKFLWTLLCNQVVRTA